MTPAQARQRGLRARRALTPRQRGRYSEIICRRIATSAWFRRARIIACYYPFDNEVSLLPLIGFALRQQKTIALPEVRGADTMVFRAITDRSRWRLNRYGILEPFCADRYRNHVVAPVRLQLICAPLSAFDAHFNRVGMGSGFYDRFMSCLPGGHRVRYLGVAFDAQQCTEIEVGEHDVRTDGIVTERFFWRCSSVDRLSRPRRRTTENR